MKEFAAKNRMISGLAIVFAFSTLLIVGFYEAPTDNDVNSFKRQSPQGEISYIASKRFAAMPSKAKEKYVAKQVKNKNFDRIVKKFSPGKRRKVLRRVRKAQLKKIKRKLKKFYSLSKEEQEDFLDKIAEDQKRKASRRGGRRKGRSGGSASLLHGGNCKVVEQFLFEECDSTTRAQLFDFEFRLRARFGPFSISF